MRRRWRLRAGARGAPVAAVVLVVGVVLMATVSLESERGTTGVAWARETEARAERSSDLHVEERRKSGAARKWPYGSASAGTRTPRMQVEYPVRLAEDASRVLASGEGVSLVVGREELTCVTNDEFAWPTVLTTLACLVPPFSLSTSLRATIDCRAVWGSRQLDVVAASDIEVLEVVSVPTPFALSSLHKRQQQQHHHALHENLMNVTRLMHLHVPIGRAQASHSVLLPAQPTRLCLRSNNWRHNPGDDGAGARVSLAFSPATERQDDVRHAHMRTTAHMASAMLLSQRHLVPYMLAATCGSVAFMFGLHKFILVSLITTVLVVFTPFFLRRSSRVVFRHWLQQLLPRRQVKETQHALKQRLPLLQALFISCCLVFLGNAFLLAGGERLFPSAEARNIFLRILLAISAAWAAFFTARAFDRFVNTWIWVPSAFVFGIMLEPHINPSCHDEVLIVAMLVTFVCSNLVPVGVEKAVFGSSSLTKPSALASNFLHTVGELAQDTGFPLHTTVPAHFFSPPAEPPRLQPTASADSAAMGVKAQAAAGGAGAVLSAPVDMAGRHRSDSDSVTENATATPTPGSAKRGKKRSKARLARAEGRLSSSSSTSSSASTSSSSSASTSSSSSSSSSSGLSVSARVRGVAPADDRIDDEDEAEMRSTTSVSTTSSTTATSTTAASMTMASVAGVGADAVERESLRALNQRSDSDDKVADAAGVYKTEFELRSSGVHLRLDHGDKDEERNENEEDGVEKEDDDEEEEEVAQDGDTGIGMAKAAATGSANLHAGSHNSLRPQRVRSTPDIANPSENRHNGRLARSTSAEDVAQIVYANTTLAHEQLFNLVLRVRDYLDPLFRRCLSSLDRDAAAPAGETDAPTAEEEERETLRGAGPVPTADDVRRYLESLSAQDLRSLWLAEYGTRDANGGQARSRWQTVRELVDTPTAHIALNNHASSR